MSSIVAATFAIDRDFGRQRGDTMIRSAIVLGAVLGLGASQATHAQEADSRAAAKPATLEEIVVTAERRSERLDQVPIAAAVISGEDLSQQGVSNILDLGTVSPSINIQNQQALSFVNIRGVGIQATNPTTSSGVAVYSDGFFIPHEIAIADQYYDVQQVEILRGPQGTLVRRRDGEGRPQVPRCSPLRTSGARASSTSGMAQASATTRS